jgi:hypothetical protein
VNDQLREQLIGYALGALDPTEQQELEQRLSSDPALRRELESVQRSLEPLAEGYQDHDPPPDLAARACAYVADETERLNLVQPGRLTETGGFDTRSRWALADWLVLSGICAAAVLLFFPAILNSRFMSHVTVCQDNLRQLGTALVQYSEYLGDGYFPMVPAEGNQAFAGIYASKLQDSGLLTNVRVLVCPDSKLADEIAQFRVPTGSQIDSASIPEILVLKRLTGGSYGYSLGAMVDGQYRPIRNLGRATFALMADSPMTSWSQPPHRHGRNILYEDLHISFVSDCPSVPMADDPFCNQFGFCEAGVGPHDAVVAPSDCPPIRNARFRVSQ